jgi:hypothetical protein
MEASTAQLCRLSAIRFAEGFLLSRGLKEELRKPLHYHTHSEIQCATLQS